MTRTVIAKVRIDPSKNRDVIVYLSKKYDVQLFVEHDDGQATYEILETDK